MKKLLLTTIFLIGSAFGLNAQDRHYTHPQDRDYRHEHQNHGRHRGWGYDPYQNRLRIVNEYRYVTIGGEVYKETYRSSYTWNNRLVSRQLIDREYVSDYNQYGRRNKPRFNVFLKF